MYRGGISSRGDQLVAQFSTRSAGLNYMSTKGRGRRKKGRIPEFIQLGKKCGQSKQRRMPTPTGKDESAMM